MAQVKVSLSNSYPFSEDFWVALERKPENGTDWELLDAGFNPPEDSPGVSYSGVNYTGDLLTDLELDADYQYRAVTKNYQNVLVYSDIEEAPERSITLQVGSQTCEGVVPHVLITLDFVEGSGEYIAQMYNQDLQEWFDVGDVVDVDDDGHEEINVGIGPGEYTLRLRDDVYGTISNQVSFTVEPCDDVLAFITPQETGTSAQKPYTFSWVDIGADTYRFQISNDNFVTTLVDITTDASQWLLDNPMVVAGLYSIRVKDDSTNDWVVSDINILPETAVKILEVNAQGDMLLEMVQAYTVDGNSLVNTLQRYNGNWEDVVTFNIPSSPFTMPTFNVPGIALPYLSNGQKFRVRSANLLNQPVYSGEYTYNSETTITITGVSVVCDYEENPSFGTCLAFQFTVLNVGTEEYQFHWQRDSGGPFYTLMGTSTEVVEGANSILVPLNDNVPGEDAYNFRIISNGAISNVFPLQVISCNTTTIQINNIIEDGGNFTIDVDYYRAFGYIPGVMSLEQSSDGQNFSGWSTWVIPQEPFTGNQGDNPGTIIPGRYYRVQGTNALGDITYSNTFRYVPVDFGEIEIVNLAVVGFVEHTRVVLELLQVYTEASTYITVHESDTGLNGSFNAIGQFPLPANNNVTGGYGYNYDLDFLKHGKYYKVTGQNALGDPIESNVYQFDHPETLIYLTRPYNTDLINNKVHLEFRVFNAYWIGGLTYEVMTSTDFNNFTSWGFLNAPGSGPYSGVVIEEINYPDFPKWVVVKILIRDVDGNVVESNTFHWYPYVKKFNLGTHYNICDEGNSLIYVAVTYLPVEAGVDPHLSDDTGQYVDYGQFSLNNPGPGNVPPGDGTAQILGGIAQLSGQTINFRVVDFNTGFSDDDAAFTLDPVLTC